MDLLKEIDHIAIAVENLEEAINYYQEVLKLPLMKIETVEEQKIRAAFFKVGSVHIELIAPTHESSTVAKFLQKKGPGFHHIAYKVERIEEKIKDLENSGIAMINKEPVKGANDKKIAFLHPKNTMGVLTEICEKG